MNRIFDTLEEQVAYVMGWDGYTFAPPTMSAKLQRAHNLGFSDAMCWEAELRHAGIEQKPGEWCREQRERERQLIEREIRELHPEWSDENVNRAVNAALRQRRE